MARAFIGVGSNVGDRSGYVDQARQSLAGLARTRLVGFSSVYDTAAAGPVAQGRFLNAAAELETEFDPFELLEALTEIERQSGRAPADKRVKGEPRTLDLDLLLYDDRVILTDTLSVPHPLMHERWFVLKPLADLAPEAVHPIMQVTVGALLKEVAGEGARG